MTFFKQATRKSSLASVYFEKIKVTTNRNPFPLKDCKGSLREGWTQGRQGEISGAVKHCFLTHNHVQLKLLFRCLRDLQNWSKTFTHVKMATERTRVVVTGLREIVTNLYFVTSDYLVHETRFPVSVLMFSNCKFRFPQLCWLGGHHILFLSNMMEIIQTCCFLFHRWV